MRISSHSPVVVTVSSLLFCALTAVAYEGFEGAYIKVDAGGEWMPETHMEKFFGEPLARDSRMEFDPGFRLGVTSGFHTSPWSSLEIEFGAFVNEVKSIQNATRLDDVVVSQVPFLVNARFEYPYLKWVRPYVGGGLGGSATAIRADHLQIGGTTMHGGTSGAVFAYQAFGGLLIRLNDNMDLGVEYRYFAANGADMEADVTAGTSSDNLSLGPTANHAVSLTFQLRF